MKKILTLGMAVLFLASLAAPVAFAFGDCSEKAQKTKVTGTTKTDKETT